MHSHLASLISQIPLDQLITIPGATLSLRNGDVHYPFRQDSDFLYLTGLSVANLTLTIFKKREQKILSQPQRQADSSFAKELFPEVILWREPITEHDRIW
jgi:Xaa-Pro aminopeptidase